MRINKFVVNQLFGLYDYEINFWEDDNISILHGPNGCGKTTILNLIDATIGGDITVLDNIPFAKIELTINGNESISIDKADVFTSFFNQDACEYLDSNDINMDVELPLKYTFVKNGIIEEFWPILNIAELLDEIDSFKDGGIYIDIPDPKGKTLGEAICVKEAIHETNINVVDERLYDCLLDYQLDTMMHIVKANRVNKRVSENEDEFSDVIHDGTVTEYAQKLRKSRHSYNDFLTKIQLFLHLLNEKVGFYNIDFQYDESKGIKAISKIGKEVSLEVLSSGEENLFKLFYDLVFGCTEDSVVLIDEPEISLHIGWQREYINILQEICKQRNLQAIIATHSPNIVDEHYDLLVDIVKDNYS